MLKFLRRYNKAILMVGGSILMVLFLLPSTTQQLGQSGLSKAVAYVGGEKITYQDLQRTAQELQVLSRISPMFMQRFQIDARRPEHWVMLVHEARKGGFLGGPKEAWKEVPQSASDIIRASMPSPSAADAFIVDLQGVARLIGASNTAPLFSTREAVTLGQKILDAATIDVVVIPAEKAAESLPEPDEARLTAHFEKYRDTEPTPDPTTNSLGLGYRRAPAVQVEWMSIDRASLEAAYTPDPVEVNKFWNQNRARFEGDFIAIKAQVEAEYERLQVDQVMDRAVDALKRELFRSTASLPVDGGYKVLPADWTAKAPAFASLAALADAELRKTFPTLAQGPAVMANDGSWRTAADLAKLPGVGYASLNFGGGTSIPFGDIALQARELGGEASLAIQKGIVYGPLRDYRGSTYYFRVLETRPAGPAESLAEVRIAVIRDLKALDGLEKLKAEADSYRERAVADGLTAVANKETLVVRTGVEVTQQVVRVAANAGADVTLDEPGFRDAIMGLARKLDPRVEATTLDAAGRTVAMVLPKSRGLVVAQIVRFRPMTVELFRSSAGTIAQSAGQEFGGEAIIPAFSYERLKERLGFKVVEEDKPKAKPEAEQVPAAAPATGS